MTTSSQSSWPARRVGVIGGGQLARMMAEAAPVLGLEITVMDPSPHAPASEFARQIVAGFDDPEALKALAAASDVITIDIEAVSASSLATLEAAAIPVAPSSRVLGIIQDKLVQKDFLTRAGIPGGDYAGVDTLAAVAAFGLPCILKSRRHGYDGRGVRRIDTLEEAAEFLAQGPCLAERIVDIALELAVMVARSSTGEIALYPVVEAEFDPAANILNTIIVPAAVDVAVARHCTDLAQRAIEALDGVGIFGIEFFLTRKGEIVLNEISPRPHNSGHYTIEACATSQFAQHLRAIAGMALGAPTLLHAAASFNLLGEPDAHGTPVYRGLDLIAAMPGAAAHLYGKHQVKPWRKMGHVTVTGINRQDVADKARRLQQHVGVGGQQS